MTNGRVGSLGVTAQQWLRTRLAVQLVRFVGWVLRVEVTSPNLEPLEVNPDYRPVQVRAGLSFKALLKQRLREGPPGRLYAPGSLGKAMTLEPALVTPFELFREDLAKRREELVAYEHEVHRLMALKAREHTKLTPSEREQLDRVNHKQVTPDQFVNTILCERAANLT